MADPVVHRLKLRCPWHPNGNEITESVPDPEQNKSVKQEVLTR
jgi:hypothetical protein